MLKIFAMDCLFCKIASNKIPAAIIFQDNQTTAFLDISPRAPGHTLIIPKEHAATFIDLSDDSVKPLFLTVKRITAILDRVLKPDGFNIGINQGRAGGAAVDHLHIHIIPRFKGDGGTSLHGIVNNPPKESLAEISAKIKKIQNY